jgi:orotate phosphoribosyltransferase
MPLTLTVTIRIEQLTEHWDGCERGFYLIARAFRATAPRLRARVERMRRGIIHPLVRPRPPRFMTDFRQDFLEFALARDVLRFGDYVTKAGRKTPYFFNAGLFNDGESLRRLGDYYARAYLTSGVECDQLFGPAYKGITLAAATAVALAEKGHNLPYSYNRKEAKDHGEGGVIVGAALAGRVLIIDDVITDGGAKRESIELIRAQGATPAAVLIAFDRMERGRGERSAVQELQHEFSIPVMAIATLDDLLAMLGRRTELSRHRADVMAYREQYGAPA